MNQFKKNVKLFIASVLGLMLVNTSHAALTYVTSIYGSPGCGLYGPSLNVKNLSSTKSYRTKVLVSKNGGSGGSFQNQIYVDTYPNETSYIIACKSDNTGGTYNVTWLSETPL